MNCSLIPRPCYSMGGFCVNQDGNDKLFFVGWLDFERTLELIMEGLEKKDEAEGEKGGKDDNAKTDNGVSKAIVRAKTACQTPIVPLGISSTT